MIIFFVLIIVKIRKRYVNQNTYLGCIKNILWRQEVREWGLSVHSVKRSTFNIVIHLHCIGHYNCLHGNNLSIYKTFIGLTLLNIYSYVCLTN